MMNDESPQSSMARTPSMSTLKYCLDIHHFFFNDECKMMNDESPQSSMARTPSMSTLKYCLDIHHFF